MAQAALKLKAEKEPVSEKELFDIRRDRLKLVTLNQQVYDANLELQKTAAAKRLSELSDEVFTLSSSLAAREQNVVSRLRRGVKILGDIRAIVATVKGQCRPKWKDAFLALAARMRLNPLVEEKRVTKETVIPETYQLVIQ